MLYLFAFRICMLGERLLEMPSNISSYSDGSWCTKNASGIIWENYCSEGNATTYCDPYFEQNEVQYIPAFPGISSGVIKGINNSVNECNLFPHFL